MAIFDYNTDDAIGSVYSVDTATVLVSVSDIDALRRMQVNHLVVLRSSRAGQHLIGLINKIMRKLRLNNQVQHPPLMQIRCCDDKKKLPPSLGGGTGGDHALG